MRACVYVFACGYVCVRACPPMLHCHNYAFACMTQVLLELKEYASEVDVDFVRKSVRTIGRCAIKLERAAERCIKVRD